MGTFLLITFKEGGFLHESQQHEQDGYNKVAHVEDGIMEDSVGKFGPLAHGMVDEFVIVLSFVYVESCLLFRDSDRNGHIIYGSKRVFDCSLMLFVPYWGRIGWEAT